MARAIWTGSISFGLVNVPIKLYSAVHSHNLQFNQFGPTGDRIRNKRVSEKTGKEVEYEKIQKGFEVADGDYVLLDQEELNEFEPRATRTIDIEDFVDLDDIDPVFYDKTYYAAPASNDAGTVKAYSLLLEALEKQGRVGIGKIVMRSKQYLAAIRPFNGVLALSTMRFSDEVASPSDIVELPSGKDGASPKEVKMASQIIDSLATDWDPSRYHDTYTERVKEYIDQKAKGETITPADAPEKPAKVVDLMAALEASLASARKDRKPATKAPAKKAAATKAAGSNKSSGGARRKSA
jgi:DNA end-binding protein Ku